MRHLLLPMGEQPMRELFTFHAELVLRHVRASSLPMRLWGWQQTEDLIALSHKHRWNAKAYLVSREAWLKGETGQRGEGQEGSSVVFRMYWEGSYQASFVTANRGGA